jgi:acyl-CoA thioesterase-1
MTLRIRKGVVTAVVLACAFALVGCTPKHAELSAGATTTSAARPVVVAIGDSIMKGHSLIATEAWPALLAATNHWNLTNLACDGAGFVKTGDANDCGDDYSGLIAQTAALHPSLILISGSSNDLGEDNGELLAHTEAMLHALRIAAPKATIVGISTVWNDTEAPDQMNDINEQVRTAIKQVSGVYLDIGQPLAGHRDWLQADDVHPTAKGQRELAKAMAGAIRSAKLTLQD